MPWWVFQSNTLRVPDVEVAWSVVVVSGARTIWSIESPSSRVCTLIFWVPVVTK
jgi:hypothetical protein